MTSRRLTASLLTGLLVTLLAGCGDQAADSTTSDATSSGGADPNTERITPGGIAFLVREHLGQDAVQEFREAGAESGSVGVTVRLTDGLPSDNFGVLAYSPKGSPGRRTCRQEEQRRGPGEELTCFELDDGRTVMASLRPEGFSDDNADGVTLLAASTSDAGAAIAMYESYDRTPPVDADDLLDLLRDPRLGWRTDPAVNRAGAVIDVPRLGG